MIRGCGGFGIVSRLGADRFCYLCADGGRSVSFFFSLSLLSSRLISSSLLVPHLDSVLESFQSYSDSHFRSSNSPRLVPLSRPLNPYTHSLAYLFARSRHDMRYIHTIQLVVAYDHRYSLHIPSSSSSSSSSFSPSLSFHYHSSTSSSDHIQHTE